DERLDAGWVSGAELARGTSTVTTTFTGVPRTVVIVLDDPAAAGDPVSARQLLLGLDGATRVHEADGTERAPMLLASDNRSVLAYDVVADGDKPMVVTIATQTGWSLVGVMASDSVDATGAVALIASRGLDAAMLPFASVDPTQPNAPSLLQWQAPTRTREERTLARAQAQGGARLAALMSQLMPKPSKKPTVKKPAPKKPAPKKPASKTKGRR
ncbi:hypothetical protein, partial [Piscinibacter sp.]|uniref:hypothetical protein n=1 Tax=Piscinibacter sp. TaxID=1903157 RepID=UPI002F428BC8